MHDTPDARYLVFVEALAAEEGQLLGVEVAIIRTPTPTTVLLLVAVVIVGGNYFSLAAAMLGTLFGWRTARKFSGQLAHLSAVSAAWSQGDFERQIEMMRQMKLGLGENLNQVAVDLQTLLADKDRLPCWKNGTAWHENSMIHWLQGVAGLVLQLEAVKHYLNEGGSLNRNWLWLRPARKHRTHCAKRAKRLTIYEPRRCLLLIL